MRRRNVLGAAVAPVASLLLAAPVAAVDAGSYDETYRPQVHFSPATNWMNDPKRPRLLPGRVPPVLPAQPERDPLGQHVVGPCGEPDLVHWTELPVAIPYSEQEFIFSGSVVVDRANTNGLGTVTNPPMVAVYTSHDPRTEHRAQSLAYSTDRGRTWTKYAGNLVLDPRPDVARSEFRDPKVFWYANGGNWVMAAVFATDHKVSLWRSSNLKDWSHLSDFGPANATGGAWVPGHVRAARRSRCGTSHPPGPADPGAG